MERRNALALAVAAGGTILASGVAFAANVGLLQDDADPVGQLETTNVGALLTDGSTTSTTPSTIIIDVPVPAVPGSSDTTLPQVDDNGGSSVGDDFDDDFDDDDFDDDDFDDDGFDDDGSDDEHEDDVDDDSSGSSGHGSDDDHDDD